MSHETGVNTDEFVEKVAELVGKHPGIYYPIALEDSCVSKHPDKGDMLNDVFCSVFTLYNNGLFDSIRLMIRYEKSLKAWEEIASTIDDESLRNSVVMDYVHPVFMVICDIPNTFKDRLACGCVKLASLAKGDDSYLVEIDKKGRPNRLSWFNEMKAVCPDASLGSRLCEIVEKELYECADAEHFRRIHGMSIHDLSPSLVSGLRDVSSMGNGLTAWSYSKSFDLCKELEVIDRHRCRMQDAYLLFGEYGDMLYAGLLNDNR